MQSSLHGLILAILIVLSEHRANGDGDFHDSAGIVQLMSDKYGLYRTVMDFAEIKRMLAQVTCRINVEVQCVNKKTGRIKKKCSDFLQLSHSNCCFLFHDSNLNSNITLNCYKHCSSERTPIDPLPCVPGSLDGTVRDAADSQLPLKVYCDVEEEGIQFVKQCDTWRKLHKLCCKLQLLPTDNMLIPLMPKIICTKRCWK
ncbi:unnamed protein product [Owenia fusiformis]|uniref:Uncharacterized protein n=1 Tax=Owenia fusiformis TaxID=6347 RepID=A0A8S4NUT7_OWEFU|nr:unnamed protein product [Owenia fusiformis]